MALRLLIGCGYLGIRVARGWTARGDAVRVLTRSNRRAELLRQEGFEAVVGDVTQPETLAGLWGDSPKSLVYAVGYDRTSPDSINQVYAGGLAHTLEAAPASLEQVVYISTTGVYGDAAGEWIDESTPPCPSRPGGIASLAAEEVLQQSRWASRGVILRLAGIYGPGRLPYLDALRQGEPLAASGEGYLNLIHVDDAADLIVALTTGREPAVPGPRIYCVSDGAPVWREDFYRELAQKVGAPEPRFASVGCPSSRRERGRTSKRISNRKLMEDLRLVLRYPSYREGIAQIVAAQNK